MCGIAGIVAPHWSHEQVRRALRMMLPGIASRGPDGTNELVTDGVGFVHTRLAIIDLQTGDQPIWNETRDVACLFNGEIYGYQALREELRSRGHTLATASDTEVLVHLYEDVGDDFVRHVHGMFASAIWDARRKRIVLARDRLGIKPLYLARTSNFFAFASTIDALVRLPISREVDAPAVAEYLRFYKVGEPRTMYRGIRAAAPGHVVTIDVTSVREETRRYWSLPPPAKNCDPDAATHARSAFENAIATHLVADVEIAAFLSGGIDSSLVVAQAQRLASRRIRTFSIGFADGPHDETVHAERVARCIGTDHETIVLGAQSMDMVRACLRAVHQPFAVASTLPLLVLCARASRDVKVVLTGDGGDEVGFGYTWYHWAQMVARVPPFLRRTRAAPSTLRRLEDFASHRGLHVLRRATKFFRGVASCDGAASDAWRYEIDNARALALLHPDLRDAVRHCELPSPVTRAWDPELRDADALRRADELTLLPDEMLVKVDRAGMAHGLEGRVPLLDDGFVEAMHAVPAEAHLAHPRGKALLRAWARELVPDIDTESPKRGFDVPIATWIQHALLDELRDLVLEPRGPSLLDPAAARKEWLRMRAGVPGAAHTVYALLVLALWASEAGLP